MLEALRGLADEVKSLREDKAKEAPQRNVKAQQLWATALRGAAAARDGARIPDVVPATVVERDRGYRGSGYGAQCQTATRTASSVPEGPTMGGTTTPRKVVVERRCSLAARDGAQVESILEALNDEIVVNEIDPALMFALERTYFSSLNHSFYLMLLATGLMSINDHDDVPVYLGAAFFVCAIIHGIICYATHWQRLKLLESGQTISTRNSLSWLGALCILSSLVAIADLAYIFVYPVLDRAKAVELVE